MNEERFILPTRTVGEQTIYLRPDTRYLEGDALVPWGALRPNTRVFVHASMNLDGEIKAFQVVWGEILAPDRK